MTAAAARSWWIPAASRRWAMGGKFCGCEGVGLGVGGGRGDGGAWVLLWISSSGLNFFSSCTCS